MELENQRTMVTRGRVTHDGGKNIIRYAEVAVPHRESSDFSRTTHTDHEGRFEFSGLNPDHYRVQCKAFGRTSKMQDVSPHGEPRSGNPSPSTYEIDLDLPLSLVLSADTYAEDGNQLVPALHGMVGRRLHVCVEHSGLEHNIEAVRWHYPRSIGVLELSKGEAELMFARSGHAYVDAVIVDTADNGRGSHAEALVHADLNISEPDIYMIGRKVGVTLGRTAAEPTLDQALWVAIRNRTRAISFGPNHEFINRVLGWEEHTKLPKPIQRRLDNLGSHLHGVNAYLLLKTATETFLLLECGVRIEDGRHDHRRLFDVEDDSSRLSGEPVRFGELQDEINRTSVRRRKHSIIF